MRHLDSTQINEIVECMSEIKCDKDDIIIREGEVGFKVYAIEGTISFIPTVNLLRISSNTFPC